MLSGARTLRCQPNGDSTIGDRTTFDASSVVSQEWERFDSNYVKSEVI